MELIAGLWLVFVVFSTGFLWFAIAGMLEIGFSPVFAFGGAGLVQFCLYTLYMLVIYEVNSLRKKNKR